MNRVLSRPCLYLRQMRSYRQDMPPPGGYAAIPWRRSIPTRGFGYIGVLISGYLILRGDYIAHQRYSHWRKQSMVSHFVKQDPDGEIENYGKSIFEILNQNFCYIQVIVFDLSYLPVTAVGTQQVRFHEKNCEKFFLYFS